MRASALALIALLLVAPLVMVAGPALAHHAQPAPVTEVTEQPGEDRVTWRSVAFAPDGSHALLAGKYDDGDQPRDLVGRWTPDQGLEIVYNRSGSGLVDVTFHESGTSLVVGLFDTVLVGSPGDYRNVWNDSRYHEDGLSFYGLRGAFRPGDDMALVAGSSLLRVQLDGSIEVLHGGRGAFFRAMDWNPAAGLTDPFAWVEAAVDRDGRALLGTIWRTDGTSGLDEDDNVALYGRTNPGRALVNTIAFAPNGSYALLAGRDGVGASLLSWAAARDPDHAHEDRDQPHDHRWQYLPADKRTGPITCIAWHPEEGYALAVGLEQDVVGYVGPHVYAPILHNGPDLFGCAFHPDGGYALAVGANGTLFRIAPGSSPLGAVVQPDPGGIVPPRENATFVLGTLSRLTSDRINVTAHVQGSDGIATAEQQGPWWQLRVDAGDLDDGRHTLEIQITGAQGSSTLTHPFLVNNEAFKPPTPTMLAPAGLEGSGLDNDGLFTLRWEPVDAPVVYELEERTSEGGVNATRTLQAGSGQNLTVRVDEDGTYLYRVRAKNAFNVSDWSRSTVVNVVLDSDGDGVPDSKDPRPFVKDTWGDRDGDGIDDDVEYKQCSDPHDTNSTPNTDDDGDGLPNAVECLQGTDPKDPDDPPADPPEEPGNGTDGQDEPIDDRPIPALAVPIVVLVALAAATLRRRDRP